MDPHRSWSHQPSGGNVHGEQTPASTPRAGATYGPGTPQHQLQQQQSPPSGGPASALQPPSSSFSPFHQAHSLANLAGISQSSPRQPLSQLNRLEEPPRPLQQQGSGFGLPGLSHVTGQQNPAERGRERESHREREREVERIHIKEEQDRRHREQERLRLEQTPAHQTAQGPPVHLHQPVAVGPRSVHGPNGLLGNPAIAGQQAPTHMPLGAPSGPPNIFAGGPVQPTQGPGAQQMPPGHLAPYGPGGPAQAAPPPPSQQQQQQQTNQAQGQGQQPILNDALSYLDQVKVQFADHPDVYNRFLDIMKDFKSGAIDTPGVIGRVSTLFAGNPDLIQGFNTFLPPGYRIECGHEGDPNAIRVTTPMGTTVSSMPQPSLPGREDQEHMRPANGTFTPQPGAQSAQMMYSPSGRPIGPAASGHQHLLPLEAVRQQDQQAIHQQEQRGVNSLQNAVSAAASGAGLRAGMSPRSTPFPGQDSVTDGAAPEKRGPVEFNHAISYVNKIKNRFAAHPDIYKQFLEILQTYQRESKPIQDVYSQVTHLFKSAPDLLEDFKQFLPESAAQAKQAAERARQEAEGNVLISNVRGENSAIYGSPVMSREVHMGTPGHGRENKLPPVGNFAQSSVSKDNKRKRDQRGGTAGLPESIPGPSGAKSQFPGPTNKRQKNGQTAKGMSDQVPVSPTLIPTLPVPIEPTTTSAATSEELSFFDKAKKTIGNKNTMNEFLKLCNLFSQDLIDRSALVHRANSFIGANPDLMKWFREWVGYEERDILIENKPRVPSGRVMLSNCRGLGPSYRLLPKRERQKPCSGRDELCNSVLNDEWASHPTWASEDSGFIAHRKNVHEEGLHRIEEERHDYDYNIEACSRTIQLLEPIATQLRRMDDLQQRVYQLPPGLGGQSETIYKRILMKLYGREKGAEVVHNLHERPYQVIPVVLNRLKERLETWKMAQREWEKVWREQTQKMFWKSLDHQTADTKRNDRRQFQTKYLQAEIQLVYEEMKRAGNANPSIMRQPQMEFVVDDVDVLVDTTYLLLAHVDSQYSADHPKLADFILDFVPLFFGLDAKAFKAQLSQMFQQTSNNGSADTGGDADEDPASIRSRRSGVGRNGTLLRTVLDSESGKKPRANGDMAIDSTEDTDKQDISTGRWLEYPDAHNKYGDNDINPHEPQRRHLFRCWANTNIYCFVRLFVMLYERLRKIKLAESDVKKNVKDAEEVKPAIELGIIDKLPHDFFDNVSDSADFYGQMLDKFEAVLRQELDMAEVEECLRRFYLQSGYPLYPIERIVQAFVRDALQIMNGDGKDKSADVFALFKKDRLKDLSTAQQQVDYRKSVEKLVKDSEIYRIDFDQMTNQVKIYLTRRDDPIADDGLTEMDRENKWRYYIASYTSVDNTDGVNIDSVSYPFLMGNIRAFGADPKDESFPPASDAEHVDQSRFLAVKNEEKLNVRIAVNNYRAFFQPDTYESFHAGLSDRQRGESGVQSAEDLRKDRQEAMEGRFLSMNSGMKDLSKEDVETKNSTFEDFLEHAAGDGDEERMEVDE